MQLRNGKVTTQTTTPKVQAPKPIDPKVELKNPVTKDECDWCYKCIELLLAKDIDLAVNYAKFILKNENSVDKLKVVRYFASHKYVPQYVDVMLDLLDEDKIEHLHLQTSFMIFVIKHCSEDVVKRIIDSNKLTHYDKFLIENLIKTKAKDGKLPDAPYLIGTRQVPGTYLLEPVFSHA